MGRLTMRFHVLPAQSAQFQDRAVNRGITRETKDSTEQKVERAMGIEPTLVAWEATVLPLNYAREREAILCFEAGGRQPRRTPAGSLGRSRKVCNGVVQIRPA